MSFVETETTAMDAELARQTLLRLKFEDETRRQADVKRRIEAEARKAADEAAEAHVYVATGHETQLREKLAKLEQQMRNHAYCGGNPRVCGSGQYNRWVGYNRCVAEKGGENCRDHFVELKQINVIQNQLQDIKDTKREEFRLQFIALATEREEAKRLEETNAALETIRLAEAAQERERLRMAAEEAEQRELEFAEYTVRMAAVQAEQEEALRLAERNRQLGTKSQNTFNVEVPQPIMTSMSIPTPMLLVGGAAALLLLARKK